MYLSLPCFLTSFTWYFAASEFLLRKHRGFREGPFQMDVADLFIRASEAFASGLSGCFYQPAVGDKILYTFKTRDILYLIEDYQTEYSADTRNRPHFV